MPGALLIAVTAAALAAPVPARSGAAAFAPKLGTYRYVVEVGGVRAADAKLEITRNEDEYQLSVKARAIKTIDRSYRLRYQGESHLSAEDLHPIQTVLRSREGKRRKETSIQYHPNGTVDTVEVKKKGKGSEKRKERQFQFDTVVLDPFAAVFLARSVHWAPGVVQEFEVFTGRDRYRVALECVGRTAFDLPGGARPAWLVVPETENLTRPDKKPKVEDTRVVPVRGPGTGTARDHEPGVHRRGEREARGVRPRASVLRG